MPVPTQMERLVVSDSGIGSIQRVLAALEHREPDRVPLDIGGTRVSSVD